MGIVALLPIIFQVLASLPSLIAQAEAAFGHKTGTGAAKKEVVLNSVKTALDVAAHFEPTLDQAKKDVILGAASSLTDAVVGTMNAVGTFQKSPA